MTTPAHLDPRDTAFLDEARLIARSAWGQVHPNPLVGCVLVKDGNVVGRGIHEHFGGAHAEIHALEDAGADARGATAYVSLEPCNHHGKTPPCSDALLQAGVRRVVFGARDPGRESGGGGAALLRAGVDVVGPVWSDAEGRAENPAFFHTARHGTPHVALKLALSLDGAIAARPGERTRITGAEADREVHRLRSGFDAVMVGAGTIRADDPRLTVRLHDPGHVPLRRIVLDPMAETPDRAALFEDLRDGCPVHVFCRTSAPEVDIERLEARGAHVHPVASASAGVSLPAVLGVCWELGIRSILCEGGARLAGALLREGLAQRLHLFVAPRTLGAGAVRAFPEDADAVDWSAFHRVDAPSRFGQDTLIVLDRRDD
ncbi:MAG: bifunctional diaminohydroxyphosphoribosylaminopyrimidine deaminase/5-amino-6-(5-phosphoribosylamino)uracil reductase RibD [Gemmatimonadota bacterium]|nr:bifunctional diaminohydroxyphosphoribosylaminopyrimidine deaminase/5-amino-6-(5-phosphoribosylamino)uracil reductase RibD [Gemmatimonadota bacterium]